MDKSPFLTQRIMHFRALITIFMAAALLIQACTLAPVGSNEVKEPIAAAVPAPAAVDVAPVAPRKEPEVRASSVRNIPDFASIADVSAKKQAFFSFLLPVIRAENEKILNLRNEIGVYQNKLVNGQELAGGDHQRLKALFAMYKLEAPEDISMHHLEALLNRVDVVPASLVLAQAANESGWGTSRFAREANNFFGVWCFKAGCGLVPQRRSSGMNHEVARYDSVAHSVSAYMKNINTHRAYNDLRAIRAGQRDLQRHIAGNDLAEGLHSYSERGEEYVREIQAMIRVNNLESFNRGSRA